MLLPTVLAMVICDSVWRDPDTGKATVLGAVTGMVARGLPVELAQLSVYFEMSGYRGPVTVRGDLIGTDGDANTSVVLASAQSTVRFADRVTTYGGALTFYNVDLPGAGEYYVELSAADTPLADRRLIVSPPTEPEDQ